MTTIRRNSHDVAKKIRERICVQQMGPGTMLPSIESLAGEYGVSAGTVREALAGLASIGVVDVQHGKGTLVSRPNIKEILNSVLWNLRDSAAVDDIGEALVNIESFTARQCADRATWADYSTLLDLFRRMETRATLGDHNGLVSVSVELHETIASISGNKILPHFVLFLRELLHTVLGGEELSRCLTTSLGHYKGLLHMIEQGDSERAALKMKEAIQATIQQKHPQDLVIYCDSLGTGSVGGSFYTLGQQLASLMNRFINIKPTVQVTGGGIDNVQLIQKRELVVSIAQADIAVNAYHGRGEFEAPCSDLRSLCCLPNLGLQISTLASSNIRTIEDLYGKTLAIGAHGGASKVVAKQILSYYGLQPQRDYISIVCPFSEAVEKMNKGDVDAIFFLSIGQSSALVELGCFKPLHLLSLDAEVIKRLTETNEYWSSHTIKANTYPGQTGEASTIGIPTVLVCHKNLRDDDAYAITGTILGNIPELVNGVFPPRDFSIELAMSEIGIPRHPGVERYFQEKGS